MSVMERGTVYLYEEEEHSDDVRVTFYSGLLTGSWQDDRVLENVPEPMTPDDAIAWAQARSPRVVIRMRGQHYSAGHERITGEDIVDWPAGGLALPTGWVTQEGMDWLDRSDQEEPISWDVRISGSGLPIDSAPATDERIAAALLRDPSIGIVQYLPGSLDDEFYSSSRLVLRVQARTQAEAWEEAKARITDVAERAFQSVSNGPQTWQISIWAVPTDANAPEYPRQEMNFFLERNS